MPAKRSFHFSTWLIITASLMTGCGLLPSLNSNSRIEKAQMNLEMGSRYLELGMLDIAKTKLETALSLDSSNPEIHNALAIFYERVHDNEQAEQHYQTAQRKNPDNLDIQNNYGRFLCQHGKYQQGISLLEKSIESALNTQTWFAQTNLGICYALQNQLSRAEQYFRQALLTQPDYPPALLEMQKISYHNRQYLSARAFMERYLSVGIHTAESLWIAFQTERALGNTKLAEEYSQQLLNSFPSSKQAQQIKSVISN